MSVPNRKMSQRQNRSVHRWPCDGVERFEVKGCPKASVPYSLAYMAIFNEEGCTEDIQGHKTFTRRGALRIAKLNERYTAVARQFIVSKTAENLQKAVARNVAARIAAEAQKPEPKPETNPTDANQEAPRSDLAPA
jgi:hypothetical protein